ncbi:MAG: hypothetical protein ACTHJ0_15740 [Flavipsychrobacter sp.]
MRKVINRLVEWILYTSLFAACCAVGLSMATERLVIGYIPPLFTSLHFFVFGATLLVYNTHHIIKKSSAKLSDIYIWTQHFKFWHYFLCVAGFLMCAISLFWLSWKIWVGCIVLGLLSFAYSIPMLPFKAKKRIRDFGWIKITVLTSVWTIVTGILPMLYWDKPIMEYPYEILMRFVFMFTLCVAFDIRDMQTDLEADIYTLPNLIGLKNSYRLINTAIVVFVLLCIIQYMRYPVLPRFIADLLAAFFTKIAIEYSKRYPSDKVYLGLIDGMMLLYAILILWH